MSEQKHTPTPWSANRFAEVTAHGGVICETIGSDYTQPQDDANAAFIVLAVNSHQALVEALQSCVKILPRYTGCGEFPSQDEECEAVLEEAREALVLASGESQ